MVVTVSTSGLLIGAAAAAAHLSPHAGLPLPTPGATPFSVSTLLDPALRALAGSDAGVRRSLGRAATALSTAATHLEVSSGLRDLLLPAPLDTGRPLSGRAWWRPLSVGGGSPKGRWPLLTGRRKKRRVDDCGAPHRRHSLGPSRPGVRRSSLLEDLPALEKSAHAVQTTASRLRRGLANAPALKALLLVLKAQYDDAKTRLLGPPPLTNTGAQGGGGGEVDTPGPLARCATL